MTGGGAGPTPYGFRPDLLAAAGGSWSAAACCRFFCSSHRPAGTPVPHLACREMTGGGAGPTLHGFRPDLLAAAFSAVPIDRRGRRSHTWLAAKRPARAPVPHPMGSIQNRLAAAGGSWSAAACCRFFCSSHRPAGTPVPHICGGLVTSVPLTFPARPRLSRRESGSKLPHSERGFATCSVLGAAALPRPPQAEPSSSSCKSCLLCAPATRSARRGTRRRGPGR